jgi:hypothetical protein
MTTLLNIFLKVNGIPKILILLCSFYILVCCVILTQGFFQRSVQKLLTKEHSRLIKHIDCEQMEPQEYNQKIYRIYKIKKIHKIK